MEDGPTRSLGDGSRTFVALGALFGFLAVLIGAFGAHALRETLTASSRAVYETGVHYQMFHAAALLFLGLIPEGDHRLLWAGRLMSLGIVLFSFSLYLLAITGRVALGAITPFGGLCFLISWALIFFAAMKPSRRPDRPEPS